MSATAQVLPWLEYRWNFDFPVGMLAAIRSRLEGTPARLEELLEGRGPEQLGRRQEEHWSVQENAGHLVMVERLWQVRLEEYAAAVETLTAADMSNRATAGIDWGARPIADILAAFRSTRAKTVAALAPLSLDDAARVAHHPRLDRPMRLVDLCLFAAEHDDHHLATMAALLD